MRIDNIYAKIISKENLYRSAHLAARGRRYKDAAADFSFHLEREVQALHRELAGKTYRHGKYRTFTIFDPKERNISAAPFRDRVIHHAVHDVIEPVIDKIFIYDSYACRKEKGTHKAVDRAQSFLRANRFCFHGDIRKYFPSIDRGILKEMLAKRIGDKDLLWLLEEIVDSAVSVSPCAPVPEGEGAGSASKSGSPQAGATASPQKGLPIGNLTSQFFANLYLNELDYFVKFDLRLRYYLRYMDDFLIFENDKEALSVVKQKIRDFLKNRLELRLHEGKSQVYRTKTGIKFLGFRICKDYRRLASENVRRFKKRTQAQIAAHKRGELALEKIQTSVRCWTAHAKRANTYALRKTLFRSELFSESGLGSQLF